MTVKELIENAQKLTSCVYCYGAKYEIVSDTNINKWAKNSPSIYTDAYIKKCKAKKGKIAVDCSGLICKAANISNIGSSQMNSKYEHVKLEDVKAGMLLWRSGHVALATSDYNNGYVDIIEAKGVDYDVLVHNVKASTFTTGLKLPSVLYDVDGWYKSGDYWYYSEDGSNVVNQVKKLNWSSGSSYFAFDSQGKMKMSGYAIIEVNDNGEIVGVK